MPNQPSDFEETSTTQAAYELGVSLSRISQWVTQGKLLISCRSGRKVWIDRGSVDYLIKVRSRSPKVNPMYLNPNKWLDEREVNVTLIHCLSHEPEDM